MISLTPSPGAQTGELGDAKQTFCQRAPSTEMGMSGKELGAWESYGQLDSPQGHFPSPRARARRPVRVPGTWRREAGLRGCWGHLGTKIRKSGSTRACPTADWPWAWRKGHSLSLQHYSFLGENVPPSPASPENKVTLTHDFFFFLECYTWHKCFLVMGLFNPSKTLKQISKQQHITPVLHTQRHREIK